ncbi:MAG TPA: site-2 protease family protein [Acidimicrobiales bacterium]|nr:site-2 protease family protein [Acidimicrobiales bacterium]
MMNDGLTLGRIGTIRVAANWSLAPIFVLVAWGLASGQLPVEAAGYNRAAYWVAALATTVAFFASLLVHELAHAAVARRHGVQVRVIVLWLFGGVAQLEGDVSDHRTELRTALAGPLASLGIGVTTGAAAWLLHTQGVSHLVVASMAWLAGINVVLGLFNLLPAFPLDGGRVLRSLLWRRWDDRARATSAAAAMGRFVGYGLIALGGAEFVFGGAAGGLWLALIGWFVVTAAGQEQRLAVAAQQGGEPRVVDAMNIAPLVVPASATVAEVDRLARAHLAEAVPVGDENGAIVGLTTTERMNEVPGQRWWLTPITEAAAGPDEIVVCAPDDGLAEVAEKVRSGRDHAALVLDHGRLVGLLSSDGIAARLPDVGVRRPAGAPAF